MPFLVVMVSPFVFLTCGRRIHFFADLIFEMFFVPLRSFFENLLDFFLPCHPFDFSLMKFLICLHTSRMRSFSSFLVVFLSCVRARISSSLICAHSAPDATVAAAACVFSLCDSNSFCCRCFRRFCFCCCRHLCCSCYRYLCLFLCFSNSYCYCCHFRCCRFCRYCLLLFHWFCIFDFLFEVLVSCFESIFAHLFNQIFIFMFSSDFFLSHFVVSGLLFLFSLGCRISPWHIYDHFPCVSCRLPPHPSCNNSASCQSRCSSATSLLLSEYGTSLFLQCFMYIVFNATILFSRSHCVTHSPLQFALLNV